jgi:hypothetical protein
MANRNISNQLRDVQKFCKQTGLDKDDDHHTDIAKELINEFNGDVNTAILSYMIRIGTLPAPAFYRVGENNEEIFLTLIRENVPVHLGAAPPGDYGYGITMKHEKGIDGNPIGMADVAATVKYIRVGNNGDFLLEVSGSNVESSDGTASFGLFDSWMKGWPNPREIADSPHPNKVQ